MAIQFQDSANPLTAEEFAQYDRQIRLWGAQAQERIRSACILLISLRALGTEIAKNLTLAGISSLTIIDDEPVTEEDLGAGFFFREEDIGKPRAEAAIPRIQELNPRVTITSSIPLSTLLQQPPNFYTPFSCIIACDHAFQTLSAINTLARVAGRPFYAAGIHGFYGFIFADLIEHTFTIEREKSNIPTRIGAETITRSVLDVSVRKAPASAAGAGAGQAKPIEIVTKRETYCPLILANTSPLPPTTLTNRRRLRQTPALLPALRALFDFQSSHSRLPQPDSPQDLKEYTALATLKSRELKLPPETLTSGFLRQWMRDLGAELGPTAAFVGGRLSEDLVNVLSGREQPIQNFALFDGEGLSGWIGSLYSAPPEMGGSVGFGRGEGLEGMSGGLGIGMGVGGGVDGAMGMSMGVDGFGTPVGMGMGMDFNSIPGNGVNDMAQLSGLQSAMPMNLDMGMNAGMPMNLANGIDMGNSAGMNFPVTSLSTIPLDGAVGMMPPVLDEMATGTAMGAQIPAEVPLEPMTGRADVITTAAAGEITAREEAAVADPGAQSNAQGS